MKRALVAATGAAALALGLATAAAGPRLDYAATALNILPPGQSGSLSFPPTATDQLVRYDGLTPRQGDVSTADLRRFFKSARFGPDGRVVRTVRPLRGLRIARDRWGVPHVYGRTRRAVLFGAGWVTAEDRGLLMNLLRGPGRVAALDAPGLHAFALANAARDFTPSVQTEAVLAQQIELLLRQGADGRRALADVDAYVAGINAYNRAHGYDGIRPWTRNDVVAVAAVTGAVFGAGGGDEARSSMFLDALRRRLGAEAGTRVWGDLRALDDPESPVALPGAFPYDTEPKARAGNAVLDDGSFEPWLGEAAVGPRATPTTSNALLVAASRSATGRPLFVAGPQTGHSFPQVLMELDLHGGGIDARGAAFPGTSLYVLLGRGKDFAWSATSANLDVVDTVVEELCGDDLHYRYRGECRPMGVFDAGTLEGAVGEADRRVVFRTTVHGPVSGYATVGGRRVAVSTVRSTRGRELLSSLFFMAMNENRPRSAAEFARRAARMEMTFNWVYANDREIAQFTSGRLPVRAPGVDPGLPVLGTGDHEWRGFVPPARHPAAANPRSGVILNWNQRPARGVAAADDNFSWGSVQRVELLARGIAARRKHTLASVVGAMNRAATQDLRVVEVWPVVRDVLAGSSAPSARAGRMVELLDAWRAAGSSRLDRDLDGLIDDPGAAAMDAAWPRLADAVLAPVLGPLVARLAALETRDDNASPDASAYGAGWYGYVDKDLRTLLGRPVRGPFATRFCGAGDLAACRASLWAALETAALELEAAHGSDPAAWRADATRERIRFGFLPATARFTNRPTFQQVVSFSGHR